jgi:hypothetical protein
MKFLKFLCDQMFHQEEDLFNQELRMYQILIYNLEQLNLIKDNLIKNYLLFFKKNGLN